MSWAEVFKINSNFKKPLNEQIRDISYKPIRLITADTSYVPEKTGVYKIICVGSGGTAMIGYYATNAPASGGGGGVAIKTMTLSSSTTYAVTVGTTASFAYSGGAVTATAGGAASYGTPGTGGTASGGDSNFTGLAGGTNIANSGSVVAGGSVGVLIPELTRTPSPISTYMASVYYDLQNGDCILQYGGGASTVHVYVSSSNTNYAKFTNPSPAAVIIIPLEMEA